MKYTKSSKIIVNYLTAVLIILFIAGSVKDRSTVYAEELQTITEEEVPESAGPDSKNDDIVLLIIVTVAGGLIAGYAMNIKKRADTN